ncbi:N-acetyltransferase [Filobacillus milosensis]|uniref:N-acetyltransferase n=1 Tax=Filobacillus milosensis TaxID=94137 RepID=A0A4Y8IP13_9BACI|nr:GNAT family protein [Filobacillus milosensis]TFB22124.1 N-acetyltransferase [Filobacillus milosensis]
MINAAPIIKGKNIILRQPIEQDVEDYLSVAISPELVRMYGGDTTKISSKTEDKALKFIQSIKDTKLGWCVEYNERLIGHTRLNVNDTDQRARYAVGLFAPSVWGKGLGTEITQLVLQYAFEVLNLHRVDLRVLQYNERAIKCYEKCGFIQEGLEREGALIEGKYETDVMMSILEREYQEVKNGFVKFNNLLNL